MADNGCLSKVSDRLAFTTENFEKTFMSVIHAMNSTTLEGLGQKVENFVLH